MNFRHPWYSAVYRLQETFGKFAIPGSIRLLAIFQFLVVIIYQVQPEYVRLLTFDWELIKAGEIWRAFSFILIGSGRDHLLFGLMAMLFYWFVSDVLDQAWGAFQVNLYLLSTIVLQIAVIVGQGMVGAALYTVEEASGLQQLASLVCSASMMCSTMLATGAILPDRIINLMMIIPIKLKWVAIITFAATLLYAINMYERFPFPFNTFGVIVLAVSLIPFLAVFAPQFAHDMKFRREVAVRRSRFESALPDENEDFHRCASCGVTDRKNPEMDFRVGADGEEYCLDCLARTKQT